MKEKTRLLLGSHQSIAKGFDHALFQGASIGCTTLQIFTKSNRQWQARAITQTEAKNFSAAQEETKIYPVIAHASYLINLGSPDKSTYVRSIKALAHELERCDLLNIPYLVFHPGSRIDSNKQACLERIAYALAEIFTTVNSTSSLVIETMAGQGSTVGTTFEELEFIRQKSSHASRLGVCLDTCHIFAAGYDFRTAAGYKELWHQFDTILGRKALKVIHLNDSQKECGARIDRHAAIGKGTIGVQGFTHIMNDETLDDIPKILETPKDSITDDYHNMQQLIQLLTPATRKRFTSTKER